MPIGLSKPLATFPRLMQYYLGSENFDTFVLYFDYILLIASPLKIMHSGLSLLFQNIKEYGLKVHTKSELNYLIHVDIMYTLYILYTIVSV